MSSYSHEEYKLALQKISKTAGKTFWLTTTEEGVKEWGYDDESTPPTQSEIETQIPSAVTAYNWSEVRRKRGNKLYNCDWTQNLDAPLTDTKKAEWVTYRQALRDVTNQSDPLNITWPTEPS